jgi:hypothetical protein
MNAGEKLLSAIGDSVPETAGEQLLSALGENVPLNDPLAAIKQKALLMVRRLAPPHTSREPPCDLRAARRRR